ncbi:response regulator [Paenibacillus glycanilyticus]|uniref:DNA-binding response regulator n=1 Tax=Paenibacillus glycanilyticus TaxID=126569 RepID=A0ABQ6GF15_9BACL|nr:response regulator [Paenibacillus glycanilyticus]GLX69448.1 DNA-binding response regulator [Paenibacillus glycanilyticus]
MYKLLLVDDEPEVTEGLMMEIDWQSCGFSEVKTAGNGKEAMELVEKMEPDVLITDISMPFMNGLELSDWVKKMYPITRVVILTGHDEFEYAKQAINLQVENYLLKPFSGSQLTETVLQVKRRMDEEREMRNNVELLREHYRMTLPIVREKFLSSLITRHQSLATIREKAEKYGMELGGEGYVVSVISVLHSDKPEEELDALHTVSSIKDLDLKLFSISNIASEIWTRHKLGKVFIHQDQVVLFTVSPDGQVDDVMEATQDALKEILQSIDKFLKLPVMIGVGTFTHDIRSLKYSYEAAEVALDYRRILGINQIICIDDMEDRVQEKLVFDEWKEQDLVRSIKVGTEQELTQVIDELFEDIARVQAPVHDFEHYLLEMVTAIIKLSKMIDDGSGPIFASGILDQFQKLNTLHETKAWFADLCGKVRSRIASRRQHSYKHIVEEAIQYTKSSFGDREMSIALVCAHLHISTGYFSSLFKKEVKMTYGAYLLQLRMEAAKEYLRTSELKTFEIAEKVGFADPNYFSLCFKKYAGVSAKEYRSGLTETSK